MTKNNKQSGHKLFSFKTIPMDMARLVCSPLPLIFRLNRIDPNGNKYTAKHKGGFILAANHTSFADPFLAGSVIWYRRTFILAAEVVMRNWWRSFLLKGVGCIKIDRNVADIEAIKKSVQVLKDGYVLTIFPQGGIDVEGNNQLKSGAVLMALQAGVPILPIHIHKRQGKFGKRKVVVGDMIYPGEMCQKKFPSTKDIEGITDRLMEEMNRCRDAIKE